jgi:hypothetical protein
MQPLGYVTQRSRPLAFHAHEDDVIDRVLASGSRLADLAASGLHAAWLLGVSAFM